MDSAKKIVLGQQNNMNNKIYERNLPSTNLNMNFFPAPVPTKYRFMPILTSPNENKSGVNINRYPYYDVSNTFFPGDRKPHYSGFAINVDKESGLRNQVYPLQRCDYNLWVPDSKSDMYQNNIDWKTSNKNLDNNLLFKEEDFNDFNPNVAANIGVNTFYNSTRVQLKNVSIKK